jgi:hypothetical protein
MLKRVFLIALFFACSARADYLVVIGDSHTCGAFGYRLFNNLVSQGNRVHLYCMESSSPMHWINATRPKGKICQEMTRARLTPCNGTGEPPNVGTILADNPGARVIVALGTNSLYGTAAGVYYQEMANTIREAGRSCKWIGPPNLQPAGRSEVIADMQTHLTPFYTSLESVVEPACELIDSRPATAPGTQGAATGDGVHRTQAAGRYWADQVTPRQTADPGLSPVVPLVVAEALKDRVVDEPAEQPEFQPSLDDNGNDVSNGFLFGGGTR